MKNKGVRPPQEGVSLAGSVSGCRAYLNRRLTKVGISIVLDCSVSGSADGIGEVNYMAGEAVSLVRDLLKVDSTPLFSERELIGRSFELYKFRLLFGSAEFGELRLAVRKGIPLNVSGVLYAGALGIVPPDVVEEMSAGRVLEVGLNVGYREASVDCPGEEAPVGQVTIPKFVIYVAEGQIPRIPAQSWGLTLESGGKRKVLGYDYIKAASMDQGPLDFHCVTGWTVKGRRYEGVLLSDLLREVGGAPGAGWVYAESATGYSSVIPLNEASRTLLVLSLDGKPLGPENGGPARLFNPNLYGWKGAKWVTRISVEGEYIDGFWEALAYHERGLVARNERFKIRNPEVRDLC